MRPGGRRLWPCYGRRALDRGWNASPRHGATAPRGCAYFNNDPDVCAVRDAIRFAKLAREAASPFRARLSPGVVALESEANAAPTRHTAPLAVARRTTS